MIGVVLAAVSSLFDEFFASVGKFENQQGRESIYTMAVLSLLGQMLFFVGLVVIRHDAFYFSLASLPTFLPRLITANALEYITLSAIVLADRTTFSFVRIGTIPLLFGIDVVLGYSFSASQLIGLGLIVVTLLLLFGGRILTKRGLGYVFASTCLAAVEISLYKYNITHFNSVAAEQLIVYGVVLLVFFIGALRVARENPFRFLIKPLFFTQVVAQGTSGLLNSFAYVFAPASIIVAATRSAAILWSMITGRVYFQETHIVKKVLAAICLIMGLFLLANIKSF